MNLILYKYLADEVFNVNLLEGVTSKRTDSPAGLGKKSRRQF